MLNKMNKIIDFTREEMIMALIYLDNKDFEIIKEYLLLEQKIDIIRDKLGGEL